MGTYPSRVNRFSVSSTKSLTISEPHPEGFAQVCNMKLVPRFVMGGPIPQLPHLHGMVLNWAQEQQRSDKGVEITRNMVLVNSGFPDVKVFSPKSSAIRAHTLKKTHQPKVKEYRFEGVAEY